MGEEQKWYTITIYSENTVGLLNRISGILLKRHINIESFTASKSEIDNVTKFVIIICSDESQILKITKQIEKQIDVIRAFYHTDEETIFQESGLFKIKSNLLFDERQIQNIIKESNAQIVTVSRDFFVLAKTGRRSEIDAMYDALKEYGISQFVRSGRIAVTKEPLMISKLINQLQE
tara:strand:+ start:19663 stop:20193 length:531 start_codon:yes stop_codon:yes gene_type:complete